MDFRNQKIQTCHHFLLNLNKQFPTPAPIIYNFVLENHKPSIHDFVKVYTFDFLEQVMDLINDHHIWSDMNNFIGMVDPNNPFSGYSPSPFGCLDEVVDGSLIQLC